MIIAMCYFQGITISAINSSQHTQGGILYIPILPVPTSNDTEVR